MMDYGKELRIDRDALDEALIRQPQLFLAVAEDYAEAMSFRDQLKEAVDAVRASRELTIRRDLADEGEKVTEAAVKAKIEVDKAYRRSIDAYLVAKEKADKLLAVKEAFSQRAFVLKDLCGLYVAGYFSATAVKGADARDVGQEKYQQRRKEMAKQRRERL
jgi:CRP-like cAMP-binding protein